MRKGSLGEDDRARPVEENPALKVVTHRACQGLALHVAPHRQQLLGTAGMAHALDDLLDDRAFIQVGRHIVGGRANELDPACVGLVIGLCALETGQKGMVDIDRTTFEPVAQLL